MRWAASHLLRQDWPINNDELHRTAMQRLEALAKRLDKDEAQTLLEEVQKWKRRDLVVKLLWQGEADLDLKVEEPSGSFATAVNRQTVGGGTLLADSLSDPNRETYVAAQGFSGDYTIQVERVWGKPLGNKAQLKIIRHQGTPQESEQLITLKLTSNVSAPIAVKLDSGRRTEAAFVPPPAAHKTEELAVSVAEGNDDVLNKLRGLADAEITGFEKRMSGGSAAARPHFARAVSVNPKSHEKDQTLYQNRVRSFVANSVDVTAQAVLSADRRSVRVSLTPVVNTALADKPVQVVSPVFPGAPSSKDP
jgi:hypothetical protein